jgi:1,4-alpha-glucan branching enzyme
MVKLFRVITDGANPDVEVTRALTVAGVQAVPRVAGWLDGSWTAPDGGSAHGHLAVSAQFMVGSRDAWREALDAVRGGDPFLTEAESLGGTTALVHQQLAEALGALPCDRAHLDDLTDELAGRVSWARRQVPALDDLGPELDAHVAALSRITPDQVGSLQRIHGDYHLGQVLHSPEMGWVLLDFEGEPLRPLAERAKPDCSLRDVVGMLRSFDYAAAFAVRQGTCAAETAAAWAADCRSAFLRGYAQALPERADSLSGALFEALWLDKALYEVVYEARNRPDWVTIPLEAVHRVLH